MTNSNSKQKYTTVGELIEILKRHDPDRIVVVDIDGRAGIHHPLFEARNGTFTTFKTASYQCVRLEVVDGDDDINAQQEEED
jgi:hypothetical protein